MFMNNTTATAIFLPPTLGIAKRLKVSPSKLLIPLAYASILGGTGTLIGTSTNVAVSGYITQLGMEPIGLFELLPIGLIILGIGLLYMLLISSHLLPDHRDEPLSEGYARQYLTEVFIMPDSRLIGQKIFESELSQLGFQILVVLRGQRKFQPTSHSHFEAEDTLLVQGKLDDLMKVRETAGVEIRPELKWEESIWQNNEESDELKIAEVLLTRQSDLIGRTLKLASFRQRYGMIVLAIYRHGHTLRDKIGRIRLRLGDLLVVQGTSERLETLRQTSGFWILEEIKSPSYRKGKGIYTLALLIAAVILGGTGWLPLSIAFLAAAVVAILLRCVTIEEAYQLVDWRLIILIGGMTAFGVAMEKTGAAELLANGVVYALEPYGLLTIMAGFFVMTILLTQPMSNAAAALVVLPVALHVAQRLQVNQRSFAIAIMLAASVSLITPFEPSCILVYGPGKYKFMDFVKTGVGLTLILMIVILFLIPVFWPL
jgi:di/tricarboxylate transporter